MLSPTQSHFGVRPCRGRRTACVTRGGLVYLSARLACPSRRADGLASIWQPCVLGPAWNPASILSRLWVLVWAAATIDHASRSLRRRASKVFGVLIGAINGHLAGRGGRVMDRGPIWIDLARHLHLSTAASLERMQPVTMRHAGSNFVCEPNQVCGIGRGRKILFRHHPKSNGLVCGRWQEPPDLQPNLQPFQSMKNHFPLSSSFQG